MCWQIGVFHHRLLQGLSAGAQTGTRDGQVRLGHSQDQRQEVMVYAPHRHPPEQMRDDLRRPNTPAQLMFSFESEYLLRYK